MSNTVVNRVTSIECVLESLKLKKQLRGVQSASRWKSGFKKKLICSTVIYKIQNIFKSKYRKILNFFRANSLIFNLFNYVMSQLDLVRLSLYRGLESSSPPFLPTNPTPLTPPPPTTTPLPPKHLYVRAPAYNRHCFKLTGV